MSENNSSFTLNIPNSPELSEIGIENFKSFGERQSVRFSRINFLFGPNSHGKTAVITAINLLLKKYIFRKFKPGSIEYIDNSPHADLSEELVNRSSKKGEFVLEIKRKLVVSKGFYENDIIHEFTLAPRNETPLVNYKAYEEINGTRQLIIEVKKDAVVLDLKSNLLGLIEERIKIILPPERDKLMKLPDDEMYISLSYLQIYAEFIEELGAAIPEDVEFSGSFQRFQAKELSKIGSINYILAILFNSQTTSNIPLAMLHYGRLVNINFVGPNRRVPHQSYSLTGVQDYINDKFLSPEVVGKLNTWLRKNDIFGFTYELVVNRGQDHESSLERFPMKNIIEYGVRETNGGKMLKFSEVGSGIGHIFQILLPFFGGAKVLVIQQPEIHLHPSLQVQLARAIFDLSKKRNVQVIIETHSEHFIKAAQLEIARSNSQEDPVLSKDDLSVIYVAKNEEGFSQVRHIGVDETGAFTEPWPDDFFELSGDLSLERLRQSYKSRN